MRCSSSCTFRSELRLCIALFIAAALALPATANAQNVTSEYFDVNTTTSSGFGAPTGSYNVTSSVWTTNNTGGDGSLTGWNSGDQMTFGAVGSDLNGAAFSVNLNTQENMTGLAINSTNANITLNGNGNFYLNGAQTWTVAAGSTLTEDNTWNGAMNFNGAALTLAGGGVITFDTAIGDNSSALITENDAGAGLTVNLEAANIGSANGGFLLTSGALNFATAAAATGAFSNFGGNKFTIGSATSTVTIGNTSGAAQNLVVGSGGYSIGGNFTFTGSSLNFGTSPVALTASPTITVAANTLTFGGVVSGAYGITLAGNGTLVLGNSNTYTGATDVTGGILRIQSSTGLGTNAAGGNASVSTGATLQLQGNITVASEPITLSGGGASGATGALESVSGANTYGGPISLGGSTTISSDASSLSLSNATAISASAATLTFAGAGNGSLAAPLSLGAGGITKNGAGIWTLSGSSNSYTGATAVNGGTLTITGTTTGTSALTVGPGATFNYLPSTPGALDLGSGTISLANNSTIGLAFNGSTSDPITSTGAASVPAGATVYLNVSGTPTASTQYTLLTAGSGLTANNPTYVPINTNYTYTMSNSDGAVTLTTGATVGSLSTEWWLGGFAGNGNAWVASDGSTSSNWASSAAGTATALLPGPNTSVVFSATTPTVAPTATVLGASMTINSLTIADTVNGLGLNADGNTLTIAPSSSSNGITMNAGVPASTIAANIALGAAQTWTNNSTTNQLFTVSGNVSNNGSFGLTVAGTGPTTISGSIGGAGGLTMSGPGLLTLSGANAYSGSTNLAAGTLYINNNAALGNDGAANYIQVNGNVTIDNTSGNSVAVPQVLNITSGYTLTFGGTNPLTFTNGINGTNSNGGAITFNVGGTAPVTIGGVFNQDAFSNTNAFVSGQSGYGFQQFIKSGSGTLIINGASNFGGGKTFTLQAGTLDLNNNNALSSMNGYGGDTLTIAAGTVIDSTLAGGVSLPNNSSGFSYETWNGSFIFGGTDPITMAAGITLGAASNPTVTVNGSALETQNGTIALGANTLTIASTSGTGRIALNGAISASAANGIAVTGGTLILGGANTFTGGVTVSAGTLSIGANSTPTSGTITSGPVGTGTITLSGGTLTNNGGYTLGNAIFVSPSTINTLYAQNGAGNFSLTGAITGSGTLQDNLANQNQSVYITGDISGFTGTISYSDPNNTYNNFNIGGTTAASNNGSGATFVLSGANGAGRNLLVGGGANPTFQMGSLSGSGTLVGGAAGSTGTATIQVGALNQSTTFSGTFDNGSNAPIAALSKIGSGSLTLAGPNTYSGGTTITAGSILLSGSGTLGNASLLTVNGATVDLQGVSLTGVAAVNGISDGGLSTGIITSSSGTPTLTDNITTSSSQTFSGTLSGSLGLTVSSSGTGAQILTGANTYSGATILSSGQLIINNNAALGNNATSTNLFEVAGNSTIANTSGGTVTIPQVLNITNGATLTVAAGSNPLVFTNGLNGTAGTTTLTINGSDTVTIGGVVNDSNPYDLPGTANNGGGMQTFQIAGTGTLVINAPSSFGGGKTFNLQGATLDLNSNNALDSFGGHGNNTLNISGGTIDNTTGSAITITGTSGNQGLGTENWKGNFTFGGTNALTMQAAINVVPSTGTALTATINGSALETQTGNIALGANTLTLVSTSGTGQLALSGVISGTAGSGALAISGGTVTLTGANTYTGGTTLSGGLVNLGVAQNGTTSGPLGASGTITLTGGTLRYSTVNQFDYSGQFSTAANQQYNVDTNLQNVTWATALTSSGGSLTKIGAGTLTLTGANTYTGPTTVNAGTLTVTSAGSLSGTSSLSVASGAAFSYLSSTVTTLGLSSTLSLANDSTVGVAFGDTIAAAGPATIGTGANNTVYLTASGSFTPNQTYTLLTAESGLGSGTYYSANTNYPYTLTLASGSVSITPGTPITLTNEYWVGGLSGNANVWALSNGVSSNWASDSSGTATPAVPGSGTTVIFSATPAQDQGSMVMGTSMSVAGIVVNDTTPIVLNGDGNILTLGSAGITVNNTNGNPNVTIGALVSLGASQSWTNNSSNPLILNGTVTTNSNLTLAGTGNIQIGDGTTNGTILGNVTNNGSLVFATAGTQTYSGVISGSGKFTMNGTGTLTLTGANNYTGATAITSGVVVLQNVALNSSNAAATTIAISSGAMLQYNDTTSPSQPTTTFTGAGTLQKAGSGTLTLGNSGAINWSFGAGALIDVEGGILVGGSNEQDTWTNDLASLNIASGATFFGQEANVRVDALTGAGTFQGGYGGAGYVNDTIGVNNGSGTFSGTLANAGGVMNFVKAGTGTEILTGTSTYTGTTTISGGTIRLGNGGTTGSIGSTTNILDNATLAFDRSDAGLSIGVVISGTGAVQQIGSGTTTLTAANTYQGPTTISAGTLALSNAGGNNIASSSSIRIGGGAFLNVSGLASGTLNLGSSTTQTLNGPSSGTGTVTGSVAVASGSTIATGYTTSGSTLAISGNLTFDAGAISSFSLNANSPNGTINPLVNVAGALSVGGTSTVNVAFSNNPTGTGTYDLFGYGSLAAGSFANLSLTTAGLPAGFTYALVNNTAGSQIDLSIVSSSLTWGGQTSSAWDTSTSNWYYGGAGTDTPFTNSNIVSFGDTAYAGGPAVANSNITVANGGVSPASITFTNTNTPGTGVAYTINSSDSIGITGSTGITLNGSGTVTLIGANTYTGTTTLNAGTLVISDNDSLGSTSGTIAPLTFNGGTLRYGSGSTNTDISGRPVTIGSNGATIDLNGNSVTFANSIGGAGPNNTGSLTVMDSSGSTTSILTLANTNTFTGSINLDGGIVNFSSTGGGSLAGLGGGSGTSINFAGGTLQWASGNTADISARTVNIGAGGATFDINGNNVTLANSIGGVNPNNTGGLTLIDSGVPATLTLSATNTYTGATNINGGTLRISAASGSATGSGSVYVNSGGMLAAGIANPGAIGNVFLGSGGTISPSGGSGISHGLSTIGTLSVGNLTLNTSGNATFNYQVNGSAVADSIVVGGALAIPTATSGATDMFNFYSVGTTSPYTFVSGDTYQLMSYTSITGGGSNLNSVFSIANGNGIVPAGDTATFATTTTSGAGALDLVISTAYGSATWSSSSNTSYGTTSNWTQASGPYQEYPNGPGQIATFGTGSEATVNLSGTYTVGGLVFNNTSTAYTLSGGGLMLNNTGNGPKITVSSGGVNYPVIETPLTLADGTGKTTTFNVASGSYIDVSGAIGETESSGQQILLIGGGTLQLDGASTYTGGITVTNSTLTVTATGTLGTGPLTINGASTINADDNLAVGALSLGANSGLVLASTNGNTLTSSGSPTLASGSSITVNSGTLALTNNGSAATITDTPTVTVATGATLQLAGSSNVLSSAVNITTQGSGTSGDGAVSVVGASTQTVGVISGAPVPGSSVTTYAGNTTVGDGTNAANLTATQILQNTLTIAAGSTVTIAPSGSGIPADDVASAASVVSGEALAAGSSDSGTGTSDPFTAIQAAIDSGSINATKGDQLENRIAAIQRLAATDPGLDVSLLEGRVLAALPSTSVWSSNGTAPLMDSGSSLLAVDSSTIGSTTGSTLGGATAAFAPATDFGGGTAAVPEPSTLLLAALGGIGILIALRRRTNHCGA